MIDAATSQILMEAGRVLLLLLIPLVIAVSVSSVIISVFQTSTSLQEPALGYAIRLVTAVIVCYMFSSSFLEALQVLCHQVWGPTS